MCILEQSRDVGSWSQINRRTYQCFAAFLALWLAHQTCGAPATAVDANENSPEPSPIPVNAAETSNQRSAAPRQPIFIKEFRVRGARHLPRGVVEETVYPFLGQCGTAN